MSVVLICPGIHDPQLTDAFISQLLDLVNLSLEQILIFPTHDYPAYSAIHILEYLQRHLEPGKTPILIVSFSAGVVGAIGAAWGWQVLGGEVKALMALDGWGVPLSGNFPIYRLSHDYFTHWSSALLGSGQDSFYADPAVEHLALWREPRSCWGWWVSSPVLGHESRRYITAAEFIQQRLQG